MDLSLVFPNNIVLFKYFDSCTTLAQGAPQPARLRWLWFHVPSVLGIRHWIWRGHLPGNASISSAAIDAVRLRQCNNTSGFWHRTSYRSVEHRWAFPISFPVPIRDAFILHKELDHVRFGELAWNCVSNIPPIRCLCFENFGGPGLTPKNGGIKVEECRTSSGGISSQSRGIKIVG
jgi:hypothetical protein